MSEPLHAWDCYCVKPDMDCTALQPRLSDRAVAEEADYDAWLRTAAGALRDAREGVTDWPVTPNHARKLLLLVRGERDRRRDTWTLNAEADRVARLIGPELVRDDPIVHGALSLIRHDHMDAEGALVSAVQGLARLTKLAHESLVAVASARPVTFHLPSNKPT